MSSADIWGRLGIAPTRDEREIKKAYARRLRERRPEEDAAAFQQLRDAYETALQLAAAGAPESAGETEPPPPSPTEVELAAEGEAPSPAPAAPNARRLAVFAQALHSGDTEKLSAALTDLFEADLSLTEADLLEQQLVGLLVQLERPPAVAIDALEDHFDWLGRAMRVGQGLPEAVRYLLARRRGYAEWEEIEKLGRRRHDGLYNDGIYGVLVEKPASPEQRERAALRLRRSGAERDRLESIADQYPFAFRFEIDADLVRWIGEQLPDPSPPGLFQRLRDLLDYGRIEAAFAWTPRRSIYAAVVGLTASGLLTIVGPKGVPTELHGAYIVASLFLTPVAEWLRSFVKEDRSAGLAAAALWALLILAFLSQAAFRLTTYPLWWAAAMLAIYLAFEEPRTFKRVLADGVGYLACVVFLVSAVQRQMESPFGYLFFVPLLHFPGTFFAGRLRLGRGRVSLALAAGFAALAVLAQLAPADGDTRRILLGLAMIGLFLLLRSLQYQLGDLILLPALAAIPAYLAGTTFEIHPALLLVYLPLIFASPFGRARLREAWRG